MIPEERCEACRGKGTHWGVPCPLCDGTGVYTPNFVQDSFEQHGEAPQQAGSLDNLKDGTSKKDLKVYMDMDGIGFINKEGKKVPFIKAVEANTNEEGEEEEEPVLKLGYKGEVTIEVPVQKDEFASKGIFGDFMDGIEASETGRTPIRFLMVQTVDELLDLFNDYKQLYDLFGDKEYLEYMNGIKKVLKAKTKK